jgi:hypothetical protein
MFDTVVGNSFTLLQKTRYDSNPKPRHRRTALAVFSCSAAISVSMSVILSVRLVQTFRDPISGTFSQVYTGNACMGPVMNAVKMQRG